MSNFVAIIPARSGSKGVPDKNIKLLSGRPLLSYSIAAAKLTKMINRIIVSTDSSIYADIAINYGAEVPFLRPQEISGDRSSVYEYIRHLLDWMNENEGSIPTYLVLLLPTTPLREIIHIENAIKQIITNNNAGGLRSVQEMSETAYKTLEIENNYLKCVFTGSYDINIAYKSRQEFPKTYQPNGYIDIIKSSYVMENKNVFGDKVLAYITPPIVEVDTIEDFEYLEYQADRNQHIVKSLFGGTIDGRI